MNEPIDISNVILTTERLILRPWRQDDLEDFFSYASVDGVGQMAGWKPHESREESQVILQRFIDKKRVFAIEYQGKAIGSLGIEEYDEKIMPELADKKCREIGYVLAKPYWGQGLMPEAVKRVIRWLFEEVGLDVILCAHFDWNNQSHRVQEKCGFTPYKKAIYETALGTTENDIINILTKEQAGYQVPFGKGHLRQIFESENISYVEVAEVLADDYLIMVNDDEHVNGYLTNTKPFTRDQEISWVQKKLAEKTPVFSMIEKKSGEFIGNVELMDDSDTSKELGIALTYAKQNLGYGSEAVRATVRYGFEEMGLEKIVLRTKITNARAIHVYEKCGFREYDRNDTHVFMEITPDNI